nr:hypothetical protein [Tanacetum cinerariifolium]
MKDLVALSMLSLPTKTVALSMKDFVDETLVLPDTVDAKGLWNTSAPYGRLVDAFIANKRLKRGKRFRFIRFLGVNDATSFARSLSNIWIGNFHLFITTARFQRPSYSRPLLDTNNRGPVNENMGKPNPKIIPKNDDACADNPSFASTVHGDSKLITHSPQPVKPRTASLISQDLINIDDTIKVLLVKIKEIETMSHMYRICKNEGFADVKIHHVGGLWIWIQFPTSEACGAFQTNESMKRLYSTVKNVFPSFRSDDRLIWININRLPLCEWGSNAFKKVTSMFGKFMLFEANQTSPMCSGRVCISTKIHKFISERIDVEIHEELFEVHVQELSTWSINISDDSLEVASSEEESEVKKFADSLDKNVADDAHSYLSFSLTWRSWIKACLESSRTSVLINGSPTSEFNVRRGLRQGDPLSPFLFIIIMEGLHVAISDSTRQGLIRGCNMSLITNWKSLIDKFKGKLSTWKANMLSFGGRLTLIKFILASLGIYYLSIFKAPEMVSKSLKNIRAVFFWGGTIHSRKLAWVKWKNIVASFKKGGLNIWSLKAFNLALLQKCRWLMFPNSSTLWVNVIKALHGFDGGFGYNSCSCKGSWAQIVGSSNYLHSSNISSYTPFVFKLFRLKQDKDCLIMDRIANGQWVWNWSSNLGVRNTTHLNELLLDISLLNIQVDTDKCLWSLDKEGAFVVAPLRRLIDDITLPSLDFSTSWDNAILCRLNIFMWHLKIDKLSHRLNLSRR